MKGDRTAAQPLEQCFPLDVLHHDVRLLALRANLVDRADVRMVDGGDHPRLAEHPALTFTTGAGP